MFLSTKTYGHEIGLSCCFRQWRAESHCRFIHGYAIAVRLTFGASYLDVNGWVVDFGALKSFRKELEQVFDHTLLVAGDDPELEAMVALPFVQAHVLPNGVGCEAFAKLIAGMADDWIKRQKLDHRVWISCVEVSEHGANSAIFQA